MTDMTTRAGFTIDSRLASFLEAEVLGPLGRDVEAFWHRLAALLADFAPRNAALLAKREALQAQIDAWHVERAGKPHDAAAYQAFLTEIGYLVPEPGEFANSFTFGIGSFFVDGDPAQFQYRLQQPDGTIGGIEEIHFTNFIVQ